MRPNAFMWLGVLLSLAAPLQVPCAELTPATVEQAVATGDAELVKEALRANHANPVIANLANAMISGDAHATIVLAIKCVRGATEANAIQTALGCARVLGGTLLSEGDIGGWSRQTDWLRTVGFPSLMQTRGKPIQMGGGLDELNYAELAKLPRPEIRVGSSDTILPLENVGRFAMPIVEIQINGQRVHALVDTGSAIALIVNASRARSLGIHVVARGLLLVGSDLLNANDSSLQTNSLGLTTSVSVGPIEMRGLGVVIEEGMEDSGFEATVGLPLLLKLKGFQIGPQSLYLYGASLPTCKNGYPFTISNSGAGRRRIHFPAVIGGKELQVVFDSGLDGPIMVQGDLAQQLDHDKTPLVPQVLSTAEGRYDLQSGFAKMSLSLLGHQFSDATIRIISGPTKSIPVPVGAQSLPDLSFRIVRGSKTACLVSRQQTHDWRKK